jgi:hypothetical protein
VTGVYPMGLQRAGLLVHVSVLREVTVFLTARTVSGNAVNHDTKNALCHKITALIDI